MERILKPFPSSEFPKEVYSAFIWFKDDYAEPQVCSVVYEDGIPISVLLRRSDAAWDRVAYWWPIPRLGGNNE